MRSSMRSRTAFADADVQPFSSDKKYVLHFDKGQIPPARAFWCADHVRRDQLFTTNPIDRFAIGDRDKLKVIEEIRSLLSELESRSHTCCARSRARRRPLGKRARA